MWQYMAVTIKWCHHLCIVWHVVRIWFRIVEIRAICLPDMAKALVDGWDNKINRAVGCCATFGICVELVFWGKGYCGESLGGLGWWCCIVCIPFIVELLVVILPCRNYGNDGLSCLLWWKLGIGQWSKIMFHWEKWCESPLWYKVYEVRLLAIVNCVAE